MCILRVAVGTPTTFTTSFTIMWFVYNWVALMSYSQTYNERSELKWGNNINQVRYGKHKVNWSKCELTMKLTIYQSFLEIILSARIAHYKPKHKYTNTSLIYTYIEGRERPLY